MHLHRRRFGTAARGTSLATQQGCACASCDTCRTPGGKATCPAFVPQSLVIGLKAHKQAVEGAAGACQQLGAALLGSVVLAPAGAGLAATGTVLLALISDCDVQGTLQAQCRVAALGARVGVAALGLVGVIGVVSVAGAPVGAAAGALAVGLAASIPVFDALGAGRAPKASDIGGFLSSLGGLGGVAPGPFRDAARILTPALDQVEQLPGVKSAARSLAALGVTGDRKAALKAAIATRDAQAAPVPVKVKHSSAGAWLAGAGLLGTGFVVWRLAR